MSVSSGSINVTFRNGDNGYEPSFDGKFVDHLFKLILNEDTAQVKKMISEIKADREKNENEHTNIITIGDEFSENEDYDALEDDESEGDYDSKIADIILPNGFKPLILSAQVAIPELIEYFISLEFDVNCKDVRTGITPILAACCSINKKNTLTNHGHNIKECLRLLIEAGAILTCALLQNNESPLHLLASNNYIEPCEYLLPLVENVDCRNDRRSTPLMIAAGKGHIDMVRLLLKAGADKSLRNINGHSSVELAMANNHEDVVSLLATDSDNLSFYRAWSLAHRELVNDGNNQNIRESFLRSFSSKYQNDPRGYMCTNLNLTHLQPILDRNGITFSQLRSMSDTELKRIGVVRFADRKLLLNTIQDIHKFPWNHESSIFSPDYKKAAKPNELIDVLDTVGSHLEFMESTMKYICLHLSVNSPYYSNELRIKSYYDKISNHCQVDSFETNNIQSCIQKMDSFFEKMHQHALEEDLSSQLNDETELLRQQQLTRRYSAAAKTGLVVSALSVVLVGLLWRSGLTRL